MTALGWGHLANIDPIILFFFLGALASWLKSDLQIPEQISKFLSVFLLLSIGLKGGHEVRIAPDLSGLLPLLLIGLGSCLVIPSFIIYLFKNRLGVGNACAIAACFGSVSAITFIAAQGYLETEQIFYSGFLVAVMALMEIPAIVLALFSYKSLKASALDTDLKKNDIAILSSKSVILLIGGFAIGFLMNEPAWASIKPVFRDSFKGVLAFFLLDLGILAQSHLKTIWRSKGTAFLLAVFLPLVHGTLALFVGHFFNINQGDQILLAVLVGSASYIAAPAAIRHTIPEATPSLYVALPLAWTFPMNVLFGIPFYIEVSKALARS